jgi:hypothetical protein
VKLWSRLLAIFLLVAIGAVAISTHLGPSELQRRHATVRVGMTPDQVAEIMGQRQSIPAIRRRAPQAAFTWTFRSPASEFTRSMDFDIEFDADFRVMRTAVDGVQLQP